MTWTMEEPGWWMCETASVTFGSAKNSPANLRGWHVWLFPDVWLFPEDFQKPDAVFGTLAQAKRYVEARETWARIEEKCWYEREAEKTVPATGAGASCPPGERASVKGARDDAGRAGGQAPGPVLRYRRVRMKWEKVHHERGRYFCGRGSISLEEAVNSPVHRNGWHAYGSNWPNGMKLIGVYQTKAEAKEAVENSRDPS